MATEVKDYIKIVFVNLHNFVYPSTSRAVRNPLVVTEANTLYMLDSLHSSSGGSCLWCMPVNVWL